MRPTLTTSVIAAVFVLVVVFPLRSILREFHRSSLAFLEHRWADSMTPDTAAAPPDAQWLVPAKSAKLLQYLTFKRKKWPWVGGATINPDLRARTLALIHQWPEELQAYMQQRVTEVLIVSNFGASGYILTADNQHFTILIDESVIGMTPNAWFRMKEGTIVNTEATGHTLLHRIEDDSVDLPEHLLEGILIHELAHCIGISEGWTTDVKGRTDGLPGSLRFFENMFKLPDAHPVLHEELRERFPQLSYYGRQSQMTVPQYADLLGELRASEFPTLYSTVSDLEFFAECVYAFVHCDIQDRPLSYTVVSGQDTVVHVSAPMSRMEQSGRGEMVREVLHKLRLKYVNQPSNQETSDDIPTD